MAERILASLIFRLIAIPLASASLGCFIRYFTAKIQRKKIRAEVFVFWPELLIAALFNLLIGASDAAKTGVADSNVLLASLSACLGVLLALWIASFVAALPRQGRFRRVVWTYAFPHLIAFVALEISLLLAQSPIGGA